MPLAIGAQLVGGHIMLPPGPTICPLPGEGPLLGTPFGPNIGPLGPALEVGGPVYIGPEPALEETGGPPPYIFEPGPIPPFGPIGPGP